MNQLHFSIGFFPQEETIESQDEATLYLLTTNDRQASVPSEGFFNTTEEGWRSLEDRILETLKNFREGVRKDEEGLEELAMEGDREVGA